MVSQILIFYVLSQTIMNVNQTHKFYKILFLVIPYQETIILYMAFHIVLPISLQRMWGIFLGNFLALSQKSDNAYKCV